MSTETNQNSAEGKENGGEVGNEAKVETVAIPKSEYETLNQTLGSLKRQVKDLTKAKDESKETPKETKSDEFGLLQKTYLRAAGITAEDEVELARDLQKRTGLEWDKIVDDDYFKSKLDALRTAKSNELATSAVKGSGTTSQAKNSPEYWLGKGMAPTPADVPDRKTRQKLVAAFLKQGRSGGKTFYND